MLTRRHLLLSSAALGLSCATKSSPLNVRGITQIVPTQPTKDGAGVALNRALGHRALGMLDPFLLLDSFQSDDPNDYLAGFPEHPHRGFETVTYMIQGAMEHRDILGNQGRLRPGSAQWMTAGHGIVHSEMPKQESGMMWGFQLWVNLPASRKMIPPRYQDIDPSLIPELDLEKGKVRVVAGALEGKVGPVSGIDVEPTYLDVALQKGQSLNVPLPRTHTAFVYVSDGAMRVGNREVTRGNLAVLSAGDVVQLNGENGRALLIAGRPINEPVARYGPFVMNTDEEIRQAFADYRNGTLTQL